MKHGISGRKLQRKSGHRAALLRNLAFVADLGDRLTAGVQVAPLAQGDQLLDDRTQVLRLGQGGDDLLMLDQRGREIGEHRLAVAYTAGEAAAFETVAHGSFPS